MKTRSPSAALAAARARHQVRVGGLRQVARALHAPLGLQVPAAAEGEQGQVDGAHAVILGRLTAASGAGCTARAPSSGAAPGSPRDQTASRAAMARSTAQSLAGETWPDLDRLRPGRRPPAPPTSARWRPSGCWPPAATGTPDGVDVGVAGPGRPVGHQQPQLAADHVVVGPVGGAAGAAVEGVEQVAVAGRALADVARRPAARPGRPGRRSSSCGCSRNPASA